MLFRSARGLVRQKQRNGDPANLPSDFGARVGQWAKIALETPREWIVDYGGDRDLTQRRVDPLSCLDRDFMAAVARGKGPFTEHTISYVLRTGANWSGPIGDFTLTVDKGAAENLVSFCGSNVRKIGPTTFQVKLKDFTPDGDFDVLILKPQR